VRRLLADTSAAIASLRGHRAAVEALAVCDRIVVTPVVEAELLEGATGGAAGVRRQVEAFLEAPRVEHVPIVRATAVRFAAIRRLLRRAGKLIPVNDIWIAASAMEHGLTVLTSDAHFERVPQILVERFEGPE
jgi:predicted nucleic acid-binding protein